jgi:AcrR family transcriptional regulator
MTPTTIGRRPAPSAPDLSGPEDGGPTLRRDAAANRDKILAAARAAFDEEGVDVGVEAIAQRAGVGVGTLYRRFPTKELLIEAVINEIFDRVLSAAQAGLDHESPAEGFTGFLRAVGWLQYEHAGCLTRLWTTVTEDLRTQLADVTRELLARAQATGAVRSDLVYEDVTVLFWSMRGVIETTSTVSPDAWLRHLDLLLAALAPGGRSLGHPPLTAEQVEMVKAAEVTRDTRSAKLRPASSSGRTRTR